jgi:hypothetical protein
MTSVATPAGAEPAAVYRYLVAYFIALNAVPFLNMVLGDVLPVFLVVGIFAIPSAWLTVRFLHRTVALRRTFSQVELAVVAYILLAAGSFVLYFQPGHPTPPTAFAYGIDRVLAPACLVFAVKSTDERGRIGLLRWICFLSVFMVVVGTIVHFARPAFYMDFVARHYNETTTEESAAFARMLSYLGSTMVGMVAAGTIALVPAARLRIWTAAVVVAVMIVGAALAQQRGGFVATIIALLYYLFASRGSIGGKVATVVVAAAITGGVAIWITSNYADVFALLLARFASIGEALGERAYSYVTALDYFRDFPFGLGLGSTVPTNLNFRGEITDGNFARIFADLGPAGLLLFLAVILLTMRRALRAPGGKGFFIFLVVYSVVALGTNVFDAYYSGHLFWAALGIADSLPERMTMYAEDLAPSARTLLPGGV